MSEEQVRLGSMESIGVLDLGENASLEIDNLDLGPAGTKDDSELNNAIFQNYKKL